jgi:hypothetical protein
MGNSVQFDLEMKEEPSTWVHIAFLDAVESQAFSRIVRDFAADHGIPESRLKATGTQANPQFKSLPMYQSDAVVISSFCVLAPEDSYGQSRMRLLRRSFLPADFKRLADDYLARFQQAFTNRVQSTFEDNRR